MLPDRRELRVAVLPACGFCPEDAVHISHASSPRQVTGQLSLREDQPAGS